MFPVYRTSVSFLKATQEHSGRHSVMAVRLGAMDLRLLKGTGIGALPVPIPRTVRVKSISSCLTPRLRRFVLGWARGQAKAR